MPVPVPNMPVPLYMPGLAETVPSFVVVGVSVAVPAPVPVDMGVLLVSCPAAS